MLRSLPLLALALVLLPLACARNEPAPPAANAVPTAPASAAPAGPPAVTGRDLLAWLRATAPLAGSGPFDWVSQADEECAEGDHPPASARDAASCFARWQATAHQRATMLHAMTPPASLAELHRELLGLADAEERVLTQIATAVTAAAPEVDRRRGRKTWTDVWGGDGPEIPALAAANQLLNTMPGTEQTLVNHMNEQCAAHLRCSEGLTPRCAWRTAADSLAEGHGRVEALD